MPLGVYLSVPFCRTKCSYCNFASDVFSKSSYEKYVVRLLEDIARSRLQASELGCVLPGTIDDPVDSIYLGGGTPSILDASQLQRIFAALRDTFSTARDCEITVECAPGTLHPALVETLQRCGVNRVSLGVQSFVDQEAHSVGRLHTRSTVLEEIARLRSAGMANINIDLIAGLPHQTAASWAFSVAETIATGVPHASIYMLEVDNDSRLGRELIAGGARYHAHFVPDDDATADFYLQACETFAAAGLAQYEISNFASVGQEIQNNQSRHNLKYWTRQPYLGFGVDAHSMLELPMDAIYPAVRFSSPDSLDAYMDRESHSVTPVFAEAAVEESFFLGLRLNRGIDLEDVGKEMTAQESAEKVVCRSPAPKGASNSKELAVSLKRYPDTNLSFSASYLAAEANRGAREIGADAMAHWRSAIQQSIDDGLVELESTTLRLTARGRLLSNEVFARFLTEEKEENKVGTGHVNPR